MAVSRNNPHTLDLTKLAMNAPPNEVIERGDVIEVTIAAGLGEKDTVKFPVRISDDGTAPLPVIGSVAIAGLDPASAEAAIVSACIQRDLYRSPTVAVTMKEQRMNRITIVGGVKSPGIYELPRKSSDLLAAIVKAGSLSEDAGTNVEIRNPGRTPQPVSPSIAQISLGDGHSVPVSRPSGPAVVQIDLISAVKEGGKSYYVEDGGVINVERRDPEPLFVQGLVRKPDRYEFPKSQDVRVLEAISLAGGESNPVADKIFVIRKVPGASETAIIELSMKQAKRNAADNILLSPGDIVSVEQTAGTVMIDVLRTVGFTIGGSVPLLR